MTNTETFREDCERFIWLREDGTLVFESVLKKSYDLSESDWNRLFSLIEDHSFDITATIKWSKVWEEFDGEGIV